MLASIEYGYTTISYHLMLILSKDSPLMSDVDVLAPYALVPVLHSLHENVVRCCVYALRTHGER